MARDGRIEDVTTLRMALVGYELEKQKIEDKISELQAQLKGKRTPAAATRKKVSAARHVLSPAARRRISAAQKKRWAEHRKRTAEGAKGA